MEDVVQSKDQEMSEERRILEAAVVGRRVYKYVDQDGVVYYSFYRHPTRITPARRLTLQSWLGVHLMNFLTALKRKVEDEVQDV